MVPLHHPWMRPDRSITHRHTQKHIPTLIDNIAVPPLVCLVGLSQLLREATPSPIQHSTPLPPSLSLISLCPILFPVLQLCMDFDRSLTHTHVGGGRARREEVHARCTYSRLFPNHTRAGTRWSSFLYEKGSPRGNLARVLVVHLVEGGSSTTGEQTNCDLTRYVKKEANHVGPTLEARLYTLEYF